MASKCINTAAEHSQEKAGSVILHERIQVIGVRLNQDKHCMDIVD